MIQYTGFIARAIHVRKYNMISNREIFLSPPNSRAPNEAKFNFISGLHIDITYKIYAGSLRIG